MNPARHFERTSKEYIILSLSLLSTFALLPFTVHRLLTKDWFISALDIFLMSVTAAVFVYTYRTRKTEYPSLVLALLFVIGEVATVAIKGPSQIIWAYPCAVGIYYLSSITRASILNGISLVLLYLLVHEDLRGVERAGFLLSLIATNLFTAVFAIRNSIQKKQLEELTLRDPLTGVNNRRAFENYLDELDILGRPKDMQCSLIILDVDHFKQINDQHGHMAGDDALVRLVTLIQTQLHSDEKIYRIGGEEYVIAPLNLDLSNTFDFADRLRKIIQHSNVNEKLGLTVSLGVSSLKENEPSREWLRRADQALYDAKRNGRNQTKKAE